MAKKRATQAEMKERRAAVAIMGVAPIMGAVITEEDKAVAITATDLRISYRKEAIVKALDTLQSTHGTQTSYMNKHKYVTLETLRSYLDYFLTSADHNAELISAKELLGVVHGLVGSGHPVAHSSTGILVRLFFGTL